LATNHKKYPPIKTINSKGKRLYEINSSIDKKKGVARNIVIFFFGIAYFFLKRNKLCQKNKILKKVVTCLEIVIW
jgi:hypothetical protein